MVRTYTIDEISLYADCKRCYWRTIHGKPRFGGRFPSWMNGLRRDIKDFFDHCRNTADGLPPELSCFSRLKGYKLFQDADLIKKWRENIENSFRINGTDYTLKGTLTDVLERPDGRLVQLEIGLRKKKPYKTYEKLYRPRLNLNRLLLGKESGKVSDESFLLVYYNSSKQESAFIHQQELIQIQTSERDANGLLIKAINFARLSVSPDYSENCRYCNEQKRIANEAINSFNQKNK